jgi:hypothetical protein
LTEIATGNLGVAGLPGLETVVARYSSAPTISNSGNASQEPDSPTVTPAPQPTPQPTTSPTSPPAPITPTTPLPALPKPTILSFGAGSTSLDSAAKTILATNVSKMVKAKAKSVIITVTVSAPKNSSDAWMKRVIATANKRGAAVSTFVKAELKKLKSTATTVVKVVTTPQASVRTVKLAAKR